MSRLRPTITEKAYQLADAGLTNVQIRNALTREGYNDAHALLNGKTMRDELMRRRKRFKETITEEALGDDYRHSNPISCASPRSSIEIRRRV